MLVSTLFAAQSNLNEGQRAQTTERLINMYPELAPGRLPVAIKSAPGLRNVAQLGTGRVEAFVSARDTLYAVVNGSLVSWDGSTVTELAGITGGRATMAWNGSQVAISAGGAYRVWDGSNLLAPVGGNFSRTGSVDYMDGYVIRAEAGGAAFDITGLLDATALDALDFATAETNPDYALRALASNGILWLIGEETVEAWQNAGQTDFPFTRLSSTVIEKGARSAYEVAPMDNSFFWVSNEPKAYRQTNFAPERVSTHAVEASLQRHAEAVGFVYQHEGHDFFCIRFEDRPAWVYDPATQSWHERASGADGPWNVTATVHHQGKWYAGTVDGHLCEFAGHQDQGEELHREAISRNVSNGGNRFNVRNIDVRLETGNGGQCMYAYSGDGGRTFFPERRRSLGDVGEYDRRFQVRSAGQHREWALKLRCTDDVDFAIYEAGAEIG